MRTNLITVAAIAALLFTAAGADATSEAVKCAAAKLKSTAKYAACRLSADAKAASSGNPADYSKCVAKQQAAFAKAEADYGLDCPTTGDESAVANDVDGSTSCVANELTGTPAECNLVVAQTCGNGVIDAGEDCDQSSLGAATCGSATGGTKNQGTLKCGAGCTFDTSGCVTCPASSSTVVNGTCWIVGAPSASCTDTCTAAGLVYDTQTETYAGSGGSVARCNAILMAAVPSNPPSLTTGTGAGLGCFIQPLGGFSRDLTTTSPGATLNFARRACACH